MRLPNWELEKLRMEREKEQAELTRQRAEERYWRELKHQYSGMAMQGMLSNTSVTERELTTRKGIIEDAVRLATALVEKLKNN